jgi:hypothetical protein
MKKRQGKRLLEKPRLRVEDNIKWNFRKYDWEAWAEFILLRVGTMAGS